MDKILEWLSGKKTYISAIIIAVFGILSAFGIVIPEWVYALLAAIGLGSLRAGVSKEE